MISFSFISLYNVMYICEIWPSLTHKKIYFLTTDGRQCLKKIVFLGMLVHKFINLNNNKIERKCACRKIL